MNANANKGANSGTSADTSQNANKCAIKNTNAAAKQNSIREDNSFDIDKKISDENMNELQKQINFLMVLSSSNCAQSEFVSSNDKCKSEKIELQNGKYQFELLPKHELNLNANMYPELFNSDTKFQELLQIELKTDEEF